MARRRVRLLSALAALGALALASARADSGGYVTVPILCYHIVDDGNLVGPQGWDQFPSQPDKHMCVSKGDFEAQCAYIASSGIRTLTLDDVFTARLPLRANDLVLTFDDGYEDNYSVAWPIMKKYGVTANLFMVSSSFALDASGNPVRPGRITQAQLIEMDGNGFNVYAHTRNHPRLTKVGEQRQIEVEGSRDEIGALLGHDVAFLAYPYGAFNHDIEIACYLNGWSAAFTLFPAVCDRTYEHPFRSPRLVVSDMASFFAALKAGTDAAAQQDAGTYLTPVLPESDTAPVGTR